MIAESDRTADEFGGKIAQALRDETAWRRLPPGFVARLSDAVGGGRARAARPFRANRPGLKAAAVWLALALGVFAASYVGFKAYTDAVADEGGRSPDNDSSIPNKEGATNMIMARKVAALAGAAVLTVSAPGAKLSSEPTFIFLRPETSSFWNTATNSTMTLPIDFPSGATRASLRVTGLGYSALYDNIVADVFELTLPPPDSPKTENVYDLVLTFDDGTERRAKLGLIQGLDSGGRGRTRCLAPANGNLWNGVRKRAVLPIPYGMTSFTVNGVAVDPDLGGAQGWYALGPLSNGETCSLSLMADGVNYVANLLGTAGGFFFVVK